MGGISFHKMYLPPGTSWGDWAALVFILCNPPFENMTEAERQAAHAESVSKPAEILLRVLDGLHRDGMLGFVLPHTALDGRAYIDVRSRLAARFKNIELVSLPPERAFATARHPAALLLAHGRKVAPIPTSRIAGWAEKAGPRLNDGAR